MHTNEWEMTTMVNGHKSMNSHKLLGMLEKEAGKKNIRNLKREMGSTPLPSPKLMKQTICVM